MSRRCAAPLALLLICAAGPAGAADGLTVAPAELIAGRTKTATITILRWQGRAKPRAAVNVGTVSGIERAGDQLRVDYTLPPGQHPRGLCLAVWDDRPGGELRVFRLPIVGAAKIPVHTHRKASVIVHLGQRAFGPVQTKHRTAMVDVLVPPGVSKARVEVTDENGLSSKKTIRVQQRSYPMITLATVPTVSDDAKPTFRLFALTATPTPKAPSATIEGKPLTLEQTSPGQHEAIWTAVRPPAPARQPGDAGATRLYNHQIEFSAWLQRRRSHRSRRGAALARTKLSVLAEGSLPDHEAPAPFSPRTAAHAPAAAPAATSVSSDHASPRRLRGLLGIGVGMQANFGELTSPRFSAEAGVEYRASWGVIGTSVVLGVAWSSQSFAGGDPFGDIDTSVTLLPLAIGVSYRYPLRLLTLYASPAFVVQLVRTKSGGAAVAEVLRYDVAAGFSIVGGAERALGPGRLFAQAGYLLSRVDNAEVELSAGGLVLEAGFRFVL